MTDSSRDHSGAVQQQSPADRRVHQRRAISPRLYVVLHGSDSDGILYDVSEGGAALDIVGPKPEGETLLVEFEMSETGKRFEAPARITWRDDASRKVGVHFIDLPETSRTHIREWLATISATETEPSATLQDAERHAVLVQQLPMYTQLKVTPGQLEYAAPSPAPIDTFHIDATRELETPPEPKSALNDEQLIPPANDRLVQGLLDSFNNSPKKPKVLNLDLAGQGLFSSWSLRRWMSIGAAVGVAVLLAFGVAARRSPDRSAKSSSVSKPGQPPSTAAGSGRFDGSENRDDNPAGDSTAQGGGNGPNPPGNSQPPSPVLSSAVGGSLPVGARPPCVNLAPPADKIRIYLLTEKGTPDIIVATYRKYLKAVLDVRVVDAAPYDLVLYVNGASVRAQPSPAGFVWSSRVFRPWYCGQSLGQLEQPEVNESLHYVQDANVDQRIRAEVAYLILRALEGLRNEHSR
jgi:hypothetical protein